MPRIIRMTYIKVNYRLMYKSIRRFKRSMPFATRI
jgi:hypothetical protein